MQEVHINVEEVIKDYAAQVADLTSAATFARAEKTALIGRINELEGQLAEAQSALASVSDAYTDRDHEVIEGETD